MRHNGKKETIVPDDPLPAKEESENRSFNLMERDEKARAYILDDQIEENYRAQIDNMKGSKKENKLRRQTSRLGIIAMEHKIRSHHISIKARKEKPSVLGQQEKK